MNYYTINKFSKIIGVTPQTLRNWDRSGKLHPHHTSSNGYRYYSEEQLNSVTGIIEKPRKVFGYCRVSSPKQKDDLERQVEKVVILYKDRLLRFGFDLIETIAAIHNCKIEIVDTTQKSEQQELVEDLVQIITVFSCKLQGKRANKAKKMIQELVGGKNDDKVAQDKASTQ